MMRVSGWLRVFQVVLLPLLLLLSAALGLGCYFETNDDLTIVSLLRGVSAAVPVTDLHLYFHGYAAAWAALYGWAPAVPWYAISLYALLYAATVLVFAVLEKALRGRWSGGALTLLLVLFFGVAWLEHGFWFNYVRVPLLLAGAGVLFAAQGAPGRRALAVGLVAFGLAWLIRPSAAMLGAAVAAPGAWWLAGRRAGWVLGGAVAWSMLGAVWLHLSWSPEAATFRRLDLLKSNLLDFQLTSPAPNLSAADGLSVAAAQHWMLADSARINEAFFARAAPWQLAYFGQHTAPTKLRTALVQLARDYFPLLLLLLASWAWAVRRGSRAFWLVQAGYALLVLGLATVLKLPPRLALPVLDFWVLSNLLYLLVAARSSRLPVRLLLLVLAAATVPYAYKTVHRRGVLRQEQERNRTQRRQLLALAGPAAVLVSDALEPTYKAESPWEEGGAWPRRPVVLAVAGWHTLHPSQPAWRHHLTGTRDFTEALRRLGQRLDVAWVLTPEGAALLNRQLNAEARPGQPLCQLEIRPGPRQLRNSAMHAYRMRVKFPH